MSIFNSDTLLLLHCNDFADSCNNYSITNNGVNISNNGKFGNCFNINQSYITFNKPIKLNSRTGFTIDFWINPSQFDSQYQYHLSSGLNFVSYDKNRIYCSICGINKDDFYTDEPLELNTFSHIAIVGEDGVIKLFVNGILKGTKDAVNETQIYDTSNNFFIYRSEATAHNPVCKIDEFRISNIARWQNNFEVPSSEYKLNVIENLDVDSSLIDINDRNELLVEGLNNLNDKLRNNLIEKGVECSDSDKMLSLIEKVKETQYIEGYNSLPEWYKELFCIKDVYIECENMITSRYGITSSVIGDKIYVIGGQTSASDTNGQTKNECYDPVANTWTTMRAISGGIYDLTSSVVNNKIYVFSGYGEVNTFVVHCYNPTTNTWTTMSEVPTVKYGATSSVVDNKVYIIGGIIGASTYQTKNECYDPVANTWTTLNNMTTARGRLTSSVVGNKIYVLGGDGSKAKNECYNPATNTWTTLSNIPTGRSGLTSSVVGYKIYVLGGYGGGVANECYNPATNTWTELKSIPTARGGLTSSVVNDNKIYIIGGGVSGTPTNKNECYIP